MGELEKQDEEGDGGRRGSSKVGQLIHITFTSGRRRRCSLWPANHTAASAAAAAAAQCNWLELFSQQRVSRQQRRRRRREGRLFICAGLGHSHDYINNSPSVRPARISAEQLARLLAAAAQSSKQASARVNWNKSSAYHGFIRRSAPRTDTGAGNLAPATNSSG